MSTPKSTPYPSDEPGFRVLLVCHANVCRSPMAEAVLAHRVRSAGLDWAITSAGSHAEKNSSIDPLAVAVLQEVDLSTRESEASPPDARSHRVRGLDSDR